MFNEESAMRKSTVIDLGWCMAKLEVDKKKLTIISPAEYHENWYAPTQEVILLGDSIIALRDVLNEIIPINK